MNYSSEYEIAEELITESIKEEIDKYKLESGRYTVPYIRQLRWKYTRNLLIACLLVWPFIPVSLIVYVIFMNKTRDETKKVLERMKDHPSMTVTVAIR